MAISLEEIRTAHRTLSDYTYELRPVERGYNNRTLYINLENQAILEKPVTEQMKKLFTGGRGFALWLLWQAVEADTKWDDPRNELILANGPINGITAYPGTGKTTAVTISPLTHSVVDSNGGGFFGPYLKFSGFDALEIQGKAEKDVIIVINGDEGWVRVDEAPLEALNTHVVAEQLTRMYANDERDQRNISVVSTGEGADHVLYSGLNLSWYDPARKSVRVKQAARGGCGRVMRDKRIKAIVVKFSGLKADSNNAADFDLVKKAGRRINKEIKELDSSQNNMRALGTAHLVEIMDHFDLLPTHNYRYGGHPDVEQINTDIWLESFTQDMVDGCWLGCSLSCSHAMDHFHLKTGPYKGEAVLNDGPEYETIAGLGSNVGIFNPHAIGELGFYCDTYGIDTISFADSLAFVMECFEEGILTTEHTGGLNLNWGSIEDSLTLLHQMARGEGFGRIIGQGVRAMKRIFAEEYGADPAFLQDIGMEMKGMEVSEYVTKESIAQQGGYGMALKGAQHDEAWLIFMDQVNKQLPTFEAKAEALYYFPMWRTWFSLHGLCKLPWNDITPEGNSETAEPNKVPEHVENYTWLYEGVIGEKVTGENLITQSERVYQLQRIFNLRLGFGTREHDYPPYRAMGPVTADEYESRAERYDTQLKELVGIDPAGLSTQEKMAKLRSYREDQYEQLINAVYERRGWNTNGVPKLETLKRLGINLPELLEVVKPHQ
ncbi:MAG: aldehyde:ferredoxin oxidoreductase [Anaerolineales bacterium]|nr:aldehyde:ferredoxin oxidoreductase [Anaerolineales bacterium]